MKEMLSQGDRQPSSINLDLLVTSLHHQAVNLRLRLFAFFQLIFSDFTAYGLGHEQTGIQAYMVVSQRVEAEHQRLVRSGKLKE